MMMADADTGELKVLTAEIIAAYVSNNSVSPEELARLIGTTYQALTTAGAPVAAGEPEVQKADKAAIRKSVTPDHLVSFLDGRKYKSLKRHLTTQGLTPGEYRGRYGLPNDYPMVAPSYSAHRSALAKSLGLGRKAADAAAPPPAPEPAKPARKARKAVKAEDETFT